MQCINYLNFNIFYTQHHKLYNYFLTLLLKLLNNTLKYNLKLYLQNSNIDLLLNTTQIHIFCNMNSLTSYFQSHTHYIPYHNMYNSYSINSKSILSNCHISYMLSSLYIINIPQHNITHTVLFFYSKNIVQYYHIMNMYIMRNI